MTSDSLPAAWDQIDPVGHEVDSFMRLRLPYITACPTYAARRVPEGLEAIILEVEKDAIPSEIAYTETKGLNLHAHPLNPGRSGSTRLILSLTDSRFRDVFRSLGVDLITCLAGARNQREAVEILSSRLARWQTFLRTQALEGLSAEQVRGLFGELAFLRRYLLQRSPDRGVNSWRGPFGGSHDFQLSQGSIEIKTTSAVSPLRFRVSNIQQLDDSNVTKLFLCLVLVQDSESEGESLPELVRSIEGVLSETIRPVFEDALFSAGYLNVQEQLYTSPRYALREMKFYRVAEGFPCLREADIPEGVLNARYDVATGACAPFLCNGEDAMDFLLSGWSAT